jgi:hypothetical protein
MLGDKGAGSLTGIVMALALLNPMTERRIGRVVAVLGVASALTACNSGVAPGKDGHLAFAQAISITFIQDDSGRFPMAGVEGIVNPSAAKAPEQLKLVVTNSAEVRRFISAIRLERKEPCWCLHVHRATFQTPTKQIEVSFCPHCFDVVVDGAAREYRMPEPFLKELSKEIKAQGQAGWRLPPP